MRSRIQALALPLLAGGLRVALGGLWLNEGIFKYRAHFGRADILLVADGSATNTRVPEYFAPIRSLLHAAPGFFGAAMPLAETLLGVALVLGVLTLPVALLSTFQLMTYWSADQLIWEYPVMALLSVVVAVTWRLGKPVSADRFLLRFALG